MRGVACILLLAAGARAQSVEGTIIKAATGRGIPGARVMLFRAGERASQSLYSATPDSEGRFRIEGVKEGSYTPRYSAEHFFAADAIPYGPDFMWLLQLRRFALKGGSHPTPTSLAVSSTAAETRHPMPASISRSRRDFGPPKPILGPLDLDSAIAGPSDYRLSASPPAWTLVAIQTRYCSSSRPRRAPPRGWLDRCRFQDLATAAPNTEAATPPMITVTVLAEYDYRQERGSR